MRRGEPEVKSHPCECGGVRSRKARRCIDCYQAQRVRPAIDRVMDRIVIDPSSGCWLWQGPRPGGRYGVVSMGRGHTRVVHRVTYEHFVGPVPDGLELDHTCEQRACANPEHLEPVTPEENRRRYFEGRDACT